MQHYCYAAEGHAAAEHAATDRATLLSRRLVPLAEFKHKRSEGARGRPAASAPNRIACGP